MGKKLTKPSKNQLKNQKGGTTVKPSPIPMGTGPTYPSPTSILPGGSPK